MALCALTLIKKDQIVNVKKQLESVVNAALSNLDNLGYQLDAIGVENQINRHNLIAFLFAEQKRLEGELDSISARLDSEKSKIERKLSKIEDTIYAVLGKVLFPAKAVYDQINKARS